MSKNLFNLTGKTALVTGATHGLGMAIAKALGHAGAKIIVTSHSSRDKLDKALEDYKNENLVAYGYMLDVNEENQVIEVLGKIENEVAPVDILVNNAGIIKRIPLVDMEVSEWQQVLNTNLTGTFILSKHVVKSMLKRKTPGKVINMCSMMSELGRDTVGAYAAAKGGLKMLTRNMATEWAKFNIQANGIGPGYFATDQTAPIRVGGNPMNEFIVNRTPAGKWGDPEELGGTAVFLASEASNFVNGQIIYVDGGILATIGKPYEH